MGKTFVAVLDDVLEPTAWITEGKADCEGDKGATAAFCGVCRSEGGRVEALELEHYPGMAEEQMREMANNAVERFRLLSVLMVHRTGLVPAGEPIVLVAAHAVHRDAAFDAVRYLMDYVKTDAPFWKREVLTGGDRGPWVAAKETDDIAKARWSEPA